MLTSNVKKVEMTSGHNSTFSRRKRREHDPNAKKERRVNLLKILYSRRYVEHFR